MDTQFFIIKQKEKKSPTECQHKVSAQLPAVLHLAHSSPFLQLCTYYMGERRISRLGVFLHLVGVATLNHPAPPLPPTTDPTYQTLPPHCHYPHMSYDNEKSLKSR